MRKILLAVAASALVATAPASASGFAIYGSGWNPDAVEDALRDQTKLNCWYLSIVDALASRQLVSTCSVPEHLWCEIDFVGDLARAEALFSKTDQDKTLHNFLCTG